MQKRRTISTILITGALAAAAVLGIFSYRAVYAQSPTPTQPATNNPSAPGSQSAPGNQAAPVNPGLGRGMPGGPRGSVSDQDLATALGITTDQLQAAYQTANTEALKEAVSKGLITQAQADQMAANGFDLHRFGGKGIFSGTNGVNYNAILAKALGMTTDKLQSAYQQVINTNLDNAVKNGSMTQAQADEIKGRNALANDSKFQASMKSAYEAAVKQAVTDGVITQAQADAILAQQQNQAGGGFFGPGFGFDGGRGGHGFGGPGGPNGVPGRNPNNPAPSATPSSSGI